MKIKVLIIDDEPRAHKVLENYIDRVPELQLAGNCLNVVEALEFLKREEADILLLDITMPEMDGFALLRSLKNPPFVIFTTAHSEFALESYDYNAIDYLKKPIPFERFVMAIRKVQQLMQRGISFRPAKENIELKIDGVLKEIPFTEILYLQSMGNYVKIFTENKYMVTQTTTHELEENLPPYQFIRIHKSFIVNKEKVASVSDEELMIGGNKLPIGKTYKRYVKELLASRIK